eukprot:gnl/TRDRNA2_/TRDRNA2_150829_c0_seq2.p1 gnl/TRDRNA2_/TRDRNA2_150829_c0~~gnl/TRDRNA2_/TRDRNA2_150829_c0_seq2.p1  ORF type:complete len:340 (-),score=54.14 gnl/TRDRNA2_/TRDRNA2_150829_c0_seq2:289-1191(-)
MDLDPVRWSAIADVGFGMNVGTRLSSAIEEQHVLPDVAATLEIFANLEKPATPPSIPERRELFEDLIASQGDYGIKASAVSYQVVQAPANGASPAVSTRCYRAADDGAKPVLMFIHGGGWVMGSAQSHHALTEALCARGGFHVVSVDYRLAPENPVPAAADDCFTVLKWLADGGKGSGLEIKTDKIGVCGDQAGGQLAIVTAVSARDADIPISLLMCFFPITDCRLDEAIRSNTSYEEFASGFMMTRKTQRGKTTGVHRRCWGLLSRRRASNSSKGCRTQSLSPPPMTSSEMRARPWARS